MSKEKRNDLTSKIREKTKFEGTLSTVIEGYAMERLFRDFKEIISAQIEGVAVMPTEKNFFEWHCNFKVSESIIHVSLTFTQNYPTDAPKVKILNISNNDKSVPFSWFSIYTVLYVLLKIKEYVTSTGLTILPKYNCSECKHKGSNNQIYPEVQEYTNKIKLSDYNDRIQKELCCFHRRTTFKEAPLGVGISILRLPRTGEIKTIVPTTMFISLKAFDKERIRQTPNNEKFTHWYPLYFGVELEKYLKRTMNSLSFITFGNTKMFNSSLVLKIVPKFFLSLCTDILSKDTERFFTMRVFLLVFRSFVALVDNVPGVKAEIENILSEFYNNPQARHKEITPSLAELMIYIYFYNRNLDTFLPLYIDESIDRQIFWMLETVPELKQTFESGTIDDNNEKICFKSGIVGNHNLMFYYYIYKHVFNRDHKSMSEIANLLDSNRGILPDEVVYKHLNEITKIMKIDNYANFFKYFGIPVHKGEIDARLKRAYKNSLEKKYHGNDELRLVPEHKLQLKTFFDRFPLIKDLKEESIDWKAEVFKFEFAKRFVYKYPAEEPNPYKLVKFYEDVFKQDHLFFTEYKYVNVNSKILEHFDMSRKEVSEEDRLLETLTWKQVYLKCYFELYVEYFKYFADFNYLNRILEFTKDEIIHFNFLVTMNSSLKSDYYYIRIIMSNLLKLKYLNIIYKENTKLKTLKNFYKGINNFTEAGGDLSILKFRTIDNVTVTHNDYNILTILDKLPNLKKIDITDLKIDNNCVLRLRNSLYYFKTIQHLNLSFCGLSDSGAKEIADGLMKSKSLERIVLQGNNFDKGLSDILYNIAFLPNLKEVDISFNSSVKASNIHVALGKLIKINQTLRVLKFRKIKDLLNSLKEDFFYALGDNSSLEYLDMSNCNEMSNNKYLNLFGSSIAFNALKNGCLKTLLLADDNFTYDSLVVFIEGMKISESDHFTFYGTAFNSDIIQESREFYEKKFICNLAHLDISRGKYNCNENIRDIKVSVKNVLKNLFNNTCIQSFNIENSSLNINFLYMLVDSLRSENSLKTLNMEHCSLTAENIKILMEAFDNNSNMHIENLNLSRTGFCFVGIEHISNMLKTNNTIKVLNLYKNNFDVNGARRLASALEINKTIESLDIGFNRIKNQGCNSIFAALLKNVASAVIHIGLRYNNLDYMCISQNLKSLSTNLTTKLNSIELENNDLKYFEISEIYNKIYKESSNKYFIDLFEVNYFLNPERLERTIWMSPLPATIDKKTIYKSLMSKEKGDNFIGIPYSILIRKGTSHKTDKKAEKTVDAFVEFLLPSSVYKLLKIASTEGVYIDKKKIKVYKSGTKPERIVMKKRKPKEEPKKKLQYNLMALEEMVVKTKKKESMSIKKLILLGGLILLITIIIGSKVFDFNMLVPRPLAMKTTESPNEIKTLLNNSIDTTEP
jgi:Ran GTPase-activating protein (RanGAP) involved in mRNA processing and transport